jgi:hypothetical protein
MIAKHSMQTKYNIKLNKIQALLNIHTIPTSSRKPSKQSNATITLTTEMNTK